MVSREGLDVRSTHRPPLNLSASHATRPPTRLENLDQPSSIRRSPSRDMLGVESWRWRRMDISPILVVREPCSPETEAFDDACPAATPPTAVASSNALARRCELRHSLRRISPWKNCSDNPGHLNSLAFILSLCCRMSASSTFLHRVPPPSSMRSTGRAQYIRDPLAGASAGM
jgi:hypothetical protein